jgi:hypothetical protein
MDDNTLSRAAGTAIERGEVADWARRLGPGYQVFHRTRFPSWLAAIFRGQGRPDMVAINPRRRAILVGDVTAQPNAAHLQKTINYAQRLSRQNQTLPPPLRRFGIYAQERYWGIPIDRRPDLGTRSNMSRRFVIRRPTR